MRGGSWVLALGAALAAGCGASGEIDPPAEETHLAADGPDAREERPVDRPIVPARTGRAIAGVSMGGFAAAHLGFKHDALFDVVACAGGLVDADHFLWLLETHFLGGFSGPTPLGWSYDALPDEGQTVLDRDLLVEFLHDFVRGLGNFATWNPDSPYWPPGLSPSAPDVAVSDLYDDEYNPLGDLSAIPFTDGDDEQRPVEVLLAYDLDGSGAREPGEPIARNFREPWSDVGSDGLASAQEPGYDPVENPDPAGDDYDPWRNPAGTEANLRLDPGEPCEDVGLDGIAGTGSSPWDLGEGNGQCDENPNLARYYAADPRRLVADAGLERLAIWLDAGIRDVFEFDVGTDRLVGELARLGAEVTVYEAFEELPGASAPFVAQDVDWAAVLERVYVRYGDPAATPEEIEAGDGGHVGDGDTVVPRFMSLVYFVAARLGGDRGPAVGLGEVRMESFHSPALEREMDYAILLPPGYDDHPELSYPVLYFLHGYGQVPADIAPLLGFVLGPLMAQGQVAKMIVVVPDGHSAEGTGSAYLNRVAPVPGDTGRYEDYVIEDLLAWFETAYRTSTAP